MMLKSPIYLYLDKEALFVFDTNRIVLVTLKFVSL